MSVTYAPTVEQFAALLPSRATARFAGGTGEPAFPDTDRVQAVIDQAASIIAARFGLESLPEKFHDAATAVIVLRAALMLEPAAWPEQARPDKSAWEQFKALYDEDLAALLLAVKQDAADGDTGDGGPETTAGFGPAGGFPPPGLLPRQHLVFDPALPAYPYVVQDW